MTIQHVDAVYENGVFRLKQPLSLPEGSQVRLMIVPLGTNGEPLQADVECPPQEHPLDAVIGICDDGPDTSLAERHDEILYGVRRKEASAP